MDDETLVLAMDALERLVRNDSYALHPLIPRAEREHLLTMPPRMRELFGEVDEAGVWHALPERREKLMRWLGFMQGALWLAGAADIETLKRMNMPPAATYDPTRDAPR